jgi:hypothetical protein
MVAVPFDPARGSVLGSAPGDGPGSWAGAPGAAQHGGELFVSYRLRLPRPERGYETRIAAVRGGRAETIWSVHKDAFDAASIERSALVRIGDKWRLYISYVDRTERTWRIAMLEAASIERFDASTRRVVLHPDGAGVAAVKDPWLRIVDGRWHMFVSCGPRAARDLHAEGDALSSGVIRSETGLATSTDGVRWRWEGVVFAPSRDGWDRFTARLSTAVRDGDGWLGLYDGSASLTENYEERCGIARSRDLRTWERLSTAGPTIGSARGPGGVRYVDVTESGDVFYEYTRPDGAHELRYLPGTGGSGALYGGQLRSPHLLTQ